VSYRVIVGPGAEQDLTDAQDWYEAHQPGLGDEFRATIDALFSRLADTPKAYPVVFIDVRRAVLRRFPYLVYFRVTSTSVTVVGRLHAKRGVHPLR
jgi:plasmid stabilization system protein ParE